MLLSKLPKIVETPKKRLGRGYGSGVGGHTVGRGQKGQKTRGNIPLWFEGGQLPIVRRTPFVKGKHRFQSTTNKATAVNLDILSKFDADTTIDAAFLTKALKISDKVAKDGFKILATGKLTKALNINVLASAGAIKAIEKAGGKYLYK